jgi:2-polyprenyl-6-methoxyphenol hydroxylase-like FAD-dependent oxidoreductase
MLALLLARRGVEVTLLESHLDFDREFRGDTLHPAILDILDQLGLAERVLALRHFRLIAATLHTPSSSFTPVDFRRLHVKYPFVAFLHQKLFLELVADELRKLPNCRLLLGAMVQELVEERGRVEGVRYRSADGLHEVRAALTVAADGRFSKLRRLAGLNPKLLGPPFELMWFRLPRYPEDVETFQGPPASAQLLTTYLELLTEGHPEKSAGAFARMGHGHMMAAFDRFDHWQIGYFFPAGQYQALKAAGVGPLRQNILALEPRFARHLEGLTQWEHFCPLSVSMSRCATWHRPGFLMIGDAAHTMTPAAGAGIKYAIEDAVVAANLLAEPLRQNRLRRRDLAEVQRQRLWPTRLIQTAGVFGQVNVLGQVLNPRQALPLPIGLARMLFGLPLLRDLPARFVAYGMWPVRVEQ